MRIPVPTSHSQYSDTGKAWVWASSNISRSSSSIFHEAVFNFWHIIIITDYMSLILLRVHYFLLLSLHCFTPIQPWNQVKSTGTVWAAVVLFMQLAFVGLPLEIPSKLKSNRFKMCQSTVVFPANGVLYFRRDICHGLWKPLVSAWTS